jgi:2-polyprenyl-3-methyl-5-hydroxy-6-metoxy-1,4-benzoquinol methylase
MPIFSERNSKNAFVPKWVLIEHLDRYWFANQFLKNKTVIDCACGAGLGTQIYTQSGAKKIYALDISEDAIAEARKNNDNSIIKIIQSSATALPFENSSVDAYISFETIEHIVNDIDYLKEAARVLEPDGIFICSTPNRVITNPGCRLNQKPINPYHVREYTSADFFDLIEDKFTIVDIYGQNKKPLFLINALNFIKKYIPHPIPARIHQLFKVFWYYLGLSHKNKVERIDTNPDYYEFLIAVCRKK